MLKNKISLIIFIIALSLFFPFKSIMAVECEYDDNKLIITFDDVGTPSINQDYLKVKETPWFINFFFNNDSGNIKETTELKSQPFELIGFCPSGLHVCKYEEWSSGASIRNLIEKRYENKGVGVVNHISNVYLFASKEEMNGNLTLKRVKSNDWKFEESDLEAIKTGFNKCSNYDAWILDEITGAVCAIGNERLKLTEKSLNIDNAFYMARKECSYFEYKGSHPTYNLACKDINLLLKSYVEHATAYKNCDETLNCVEDLNEMNLIESQIRNHCQSILETYNFDGGNSQACMETCFDISNTLSSLKKDLGFSSVNGECGLSGRIIIWISNVVRWAKYLVPVAVMVLGIIDFIKAIASNKDDEMKKAQKKFIIRLISAALIFIVPFIIEFVLNKMGFDANGCGIIDL